MGYLRLCMGNVSNVFDDLPVSRAPLVGEQEGWLGGQGGNGVLPILPSFHFSYKQRNGI